MADEVISRRPRHSEIDSCNSKTRLENSDPIGVTKYSIPNQRKSMPCQDSKHSSNSSDIFKDKAISFLKSINTGSPQILGKLGPLTEPLQLVPCDANPTLGLIRNQEENLELGKVQAWVTSGIIKKSYAHCLNNSDFVVSSEKEWINLNEYPGRMIQSPIKDEMNEEFWQAHTYLDPKLTLSKLMNLREDLIIEVWKNCRFEPATLAIGLTCFDRLLHMNLVNKRNRKLYAAVCVLLAFKCFEETHLDETRHKMKHLLNQLYHMDKNDLLTAKMILEAEFSVYSYLNFSIHLKYEEIKDNLAYIQSRLSN